MKNYTDILQFHIERNFKRINPKYAKGASDRQIAKLQSELDLHYKLAGFAVKKSRGYGALEQALRQIETTSGPRRRWYMNLRVQLASMSVVALFALVFIGGTRLFSSQKSASNFTQIGRASCRERV